MPRLDRVAARVLVRAPTGRYLLLRLEPSFRDPFWITPGGGLDEGETPPDAARRELYEEVGRDDLALGPQLWFRHVRFRWEEWEVNQQEHVFLVEAPDEFEPAILHPDEEPLVGGRWFSASDLRSLDDTVYPPNLAELLEGLARDGTPPEPVRLPDADEI